MKISVTLADIKAATPNGSFNPVSIALARITGRKWFICKDNTAMEMESPFRDIPLPQVVVTLLDQYFQSWVMRPFEFEFEALTVPEPRTVPMYQAPVQQGQVALAA